MNIEYIEKNSATWTDGTETSAEVYVKFKEFEDIQPFTARVDDVEGIAPLIINMLKAGEAGVVKSFAEYQAETAQNLENVKTEISSEILKLKPDAVLPTDADFNGDGEATIQELQTLLDRLETKAAEAVFDAKYGI